MKIKRKDYVGMWFKARKAFGIGDEMNVAKVNLATQDVEWQVYHHSEMDGLGGMACALRKDGYPSLNLPKSSESTKPSFLGFLKLMFKQPKPTAPKTIRWQKQYTVDNTKQGEIAYTYFDAAETKIIKSRAKRARVPLNHYVFWALNKSIAINLLQSGQQYYWLYPVNLRGPLNFGTDYFNYSSSIDVLASDSIDARSLHQNIKEPIKAKSFWVNWYLANIGKVIGERGVRFLYRKLSNKNYLAGSFSFLGQWPLKEDRQKQRNPDDMWVSCGIGTANYPVSTGIIIWYDRLSIGIKLHPSICQDVAITRRCLNDWKIFLLEGEGDADASH